MSNQRVKVKSFAIEEKNKILKCLEKPGMDKKSEKYGLSESFLRGFIKNKAQFLEKFQCSSVESAKRKRIWYGYFPDLEQGVKLWIFQLMLKDLCFKHGVFAPKTEELLNPLHDDGIPIDFD